MRFSVVCDDCGERLVDWLDGADRWLSADEAKQALLENGWREEDGRVRCSMCIMNETPEAKKARARFEKSKQKLKRNKK